MQREEHAGICLRFWPLRFSPQRARMAGRRPHRQALAESTDPVGNLQPYVVRPAATQVLVYQPWTIAGKFARTQGRLNAAMIRFAAPIAMVVGGAFIIIGLIQLA